MNAIRATGWGSVSPAGWGVRVLRDVCEADQPCPTSLIEHPGRPKPLAVRRVPSPSPRPVFQTHPRLRRSSSISIHAAAAALEALGVQLEPVRTGQKRIGIVLTSLTGCVSYSRRFYDEVLKDPSTASPILFPETVFNAPASHLATYLNSNAVSYTLIGDAGTFLQGLALAAEWLLEGRVDLGLVVGSEEFDWLVAGAQQLFNQDVIVAEGAGALLLERAEASEEGIQLDCITEPVLYTRLTPPPTAASKVYQAVGGGDEQAILLDSRIGVSVLDRAESSAWQNWTGPRISVKKTLGESFAAGSAWQCVLAVDRLSRGLHPRAIVNVVGSSQQAIAARFSQPAVRAS